MALGKGELDLDGDKQDLRSAGGGDTPALKHTPCSRENVEFTVVFCLVLSHRLDTHRDLTRFHLILYFLTNAINIYAVIINNDTIIILVLLTFLRAVYGKGKYFRKLRKGVNL